MENTNISWATNTFNPWQEQGGTRVVAPESMWQEPVKWEAKYEDQFTEAEADFLAGNTMAFVPPNRPRVFCASLADVFEEWSGSMINHEGAILFVKESLFGWAGTEKMQKWLTGKGWRLGTMDDVRARLFRLIDATPHLDWLLLTKRPENIHKMWPYMTTDYGQDQDAHVQLPEVSR